MDPLYYRVYVARRQGSSPPHGCPRPVVGFRHPSKNATGAKLHTARRVRGKLMENSRKRSGGLAFFDRLPGGISHGEGNSLSLDINIKDCNHHLLVDLYHLIGILHEAV